MYVADILIYIQNLHARKIKKEPASLAPENFADRAGISLNRTNICVLANHAGKYLRRSSDGISIYLMGTDDRLTKSDRCTKMTEINPLIMIENK